MSLSVAYIFHGLVKLNAHTTIPTGHRYKCINANFQRVFSRLTFELRQCKADKCIRGRHSRAVFIGYRTNDEGQRVKLVE